jgi:hypothetical protein
MKKCDRSRIILFDGKLSFLAIFAESLVDSAIGSAADETYDVISISNPDLAGISTRSPRFDGIYTTTCQPRTICSKLLGEEKVPDDGNISQYSSLLTMPIA